MELKGEKKEELDHAQNKADEKAEEVADLERKPERASLDPVSFGESVTSTCEGRQPSAPATARCSWVLLILERPSMPSFLASL